MSFLRKLYGGKKDEKGPTSEEAIQKLRDTEELLIRKQKYVKKKIDAEIQTAKKNGTKNKRPAIAALMRKKCYEKQLTHINETLRQFEGHKEALGDANTTAQVLSIMKEAANAMKLSFQDINTENVPDMMDNDYNTPREITKVFPNYIDKEELERELEELEKEDLDKETNMPTDKLPEDDDDLAQLHAWAVAR